MCGIAGHPGVLNGQLDRALQALAFRGPDQAGTLQLAGFGLGCRRLAITDLRAGQPLVLRVPGGLIAIVMNGSLAGPDALRRRLNALGETTTSRNDAEIPLRLYRAGGIDALASLSGQFAFAIYDEVRRALVLARDRFGEKPLFVHERAGDFPVFASTSAAMRPLTQRCRAELARRDLARFARFGWIDLEKSCFGLPWRAFPRGTLRLYRRDGGMQERRLDPPAVDPVGDEQGLSRLLVSAVADRAHGDRDLGVFLSGGVDSSLVAWLLRLAGRRPMCLSLDFDGDAGESARAARIAAALSLPHVRGTAGPEALDALPRLVRLSGLPVGDPSVLAVHALSRLAVREGIGIAMSGEGGDELFLGYRRQRAYAWACLAHELLPAPLLERARRRVRGTGALARFASAASSGDYAELWAVADRSDLQQAFGDSGQNGSVGASGHAGEPFEVARAADLAGYLAWDLCPKLDLASLAAGLEARSPLLDERLLGYARRWVRRPGELVGKPALRALLARVLPAELRGGRKRGFAPPIGRWIAGSAWVEDLLRSEHAPFQRAVALRWLKELRGGAAQRGHLLFNLCSLALFAEAHA